MKQILKYLIFLIIGIILFVLVNSKDGFSIGGSWCIFQNPDANPKQGENLVPVPESWDNVQDALDWLHEYNTHDDDGNEIFLSPIICNPQGVIVAVTPGTLTVTIESLVWANALDINPNTTLESL